MLVICEIYKECFERQSGINFICDHSKPLQKYEDGKCEQSGQCGECNSKALRKDKLIKLNENFNRCD